MSEVAHKNGARILIMTTKPKPSKKIHEGQSLIMVDIENQVGASELTPESVVEVKTALDVGDRKLRHEGIRFKFHKSVRLTFQ